MRFQRTTVVFATICTLLAVASPALAADEEWEFDGGGWGHGVGLSQYGALGQAQDGRTSTQILQHYYTGTSVGDMPAGHWSTTPYGLWVGLVSNTTSVSLSAVGGPLTICESATDCTHDLGSPATPVTFTDRTIDPSENWVLEVNTLNTDQCRFRKGQEGNLGWGSCEAKLTKALNNTSVRFKVNGKEYAWGEIRFTNSTAGFHTIVALDLEHYLRGLAEVPSSWPAQALRTQAIIGRSYAVATAHERGTATGLGTLSSCGCHLRSTTADQAFTGWSKEGGSFGASWVAAVDATTGDIMRHPQSNYFDDIAKAFYSSSNGGASEDNEFVWNGTPLPWLRSVPDQWSSDPSINPLARWTVVVPAPKIEAAFGWDSVTMVEVTSGPPGAVTRFTGRDNGSTVTKNLWGDALRLFLGANAYRRDGAAVRVSPYVSTVRYRGPFLDIAGSIFEEAITWMSQQEITKGCNPPTNTNYCPNANVTRGEMAVFLDRVLGLPAAQADHFSDDSGAFYEEAANRIFEAGITSGCGTNKFCGGQSLPREQMAAFLVRARHLPPPTVDHFVDDENSMFEASINGIADAGITLGCNPPANDRFCPTDKVTRGQMAAFFERAWGS